METAKICNALAAALKISGLVGASFSNPLSTPFEQLHHHLCKSALSIAPSGRAEHDETRLMLALRAFAESEIFQKIYLDLISRLRDEVFGFDFVFERIPVIRCIAPHQHNLQPLRLPNGNLMAHHTDLLYADPCGQVNCWLPFTENINSASLQLCALAPSLSILQDFFQAHQLGDHIPDGTRAQFFQFICNDQQRLKTILSSCVPLNSTAGMTQFFDMRRLHATADNRELTTRISMDFRVVPLNVYALLAAKVNGNTNANDIPTYAGNRLLKDEYYHVLQASQLPALSL